MKKQQGGKSMSRIMIALLFAVLMAAGSFGNTLQTSGNFPMSNEWIVYNKTLATPGTVETISLARATVALNIQAKGGDVYLCLNGTTTEAKWTVGQDQTLWDHFPTPLNATTMYVWTNTANATVEVLQVYR